MKWVWGCSTPTPDNSIPGLHMVFMQPALGVSVTLSVESCPSVCLSVRPSIRHVPPILSK